MARRIPTFAVVLRTQAPYWISVSCRGVFDVAIDVAVWRHGFQVLSCGVRHLP